MFSILYFSATGNTSYLAKRAAKNLGVENQNVYRLDKVQVTDITPNEHLILMYPIHGFNPPRTVVRFVKNLPKGLFSKVSLIAVGCNNLWLNDSVSKPLRKIIESLSIDIVVDEILAMPLTLVMKFPEETKLKVVKEAEERLDVVIDNIKNEIKTSKSISFKSKAIHFLGKLESPAARMFGLELHANKTCTSCSICWNNCPENNIKKGKNGKPKFGFSCSMCMRCIYQCPEKSISPYISKFLTVKDGYKLED